MENKNIDYSDFSSNDLNETSTFNDLVSRAERKKREIEKEQKELELEKTQEQKELEKTQKLEQTRQIEELKKTLNFDADELKGKKKKKKKNDIPMEPPIVEEIEKTLKMQKVKLENNISNKSNNKFNIFLFVMLIFVSLSSLGYLIYKYNDFINIYLLLIDNGIIILFNILYGISLFSKDKIRKIFNAFSTIILIGFIIFNILYVLNIIKLPTNPTLPDFKGKNISEVISYTTKNNITLTQVYEYNDSLEEYKVITQNVNAGILAKKVKKLTILISNGANPDKIVTIPNMVGYDIDKAIETINKNFLSNVTVNFEINNEIKKDIIISQDKFGEMRRSDALTILVSLGTEEELIPVSMIDLKNKTLFDATLWLKRNGIKYELKYEFSDTIKRNSIISQSDKKGTTVDPKTSSVTLIVSKGKEIEIPNINQMTVDEATSWIIKNKLKVTYSEQYDNEFKIGSIISCNYEVGSKVEEGTVINLIISKGKLKMERFENIVDFRAWADNLGLKYEETDEYNDLDSGKIISTTPKEGEFITINETIKVVVSKGKAVTIPNFYNMNVNDVKTKCSNVGLRCTFSYSYNSSVAANIAYKQSMSANSTVPNGTNIIVYISKGTQPTSGGGSTPTPPTCTSTATHTLIIQSSWVTGGSASTTISTLKTKLAANYPLVTFTYITKPGNQNPGFIHADSAITNGSTIKDCQTYIITINE